MDISITKKCEESKLIRKIAPGLWVFRSHLSRLLQNLVESLDNYMSKELSFDRVLFPKIIPFKYFKKYGSTFYPENIVFRINKRDLNQESFILDPAATSFYSSYSNSLIEDSELPIKITDLGIGVSFRKEDPKTINEFYRAREYYKKEFLFIGYPDDVNEIQKKLLEQLESFLSKIELSVHYTDEKIISDDKRFTTKEINSPCDGDKLEVASTGIREDLITSHYEIRSVSKKELWSGFLSIGLSRLVYCILSKYGLNPNLWPKL